MQRMTVIAAVFVFLWADSSAAKSSETEAAQNSDVQQDSAYRSLEGSYALGTKDTDPPPGAKVDRLSLRITGSDAERIYKAMAASEQRVDCEGQPHENYTRKVAGGLECDKDQNGYTCTVGIDLDTGAAVEGYVCD